MEIIKVSIVIFSIKLDGRDKRKIWMQVRKTPDSLEGLLEFPGGKIEPDEIPLEAAVREVYEEVGIQISINKINFFDTYSYFHDGKSILLHCFFGGPHEGLENKGKWVILSRKTLSKPLKGRIPLINHQIIDDFILYLERNSFAF